MEMDLRNKATSELRTVFLSPLGVPNSQVPLHVEICYGNKDRCMLISYLLTKTAELKGSFHLFSQTLQLEGTVLNIFAIKRVPFGICWIPCIRYPAGPQDLTTQLKQEPQCGVTDSDICVLSIV